MNDKRYVSADDFFRLSLQVNDNMKDIQEIKNEMITKQYFNGVMKGFSSPKIMDEVVFLNGEKFSATLVYEQIYESAKQSLYIIDNYISPKTLIHLKGLSNTVQVILFSDNLGKGLSKIEFSDFKAQYPDGDISLQITNGKYHDKYIIVDHGTEDEAIYHCGASSKDAGNRIASIVKVRDVSIYKDMIRVLLKSPALLL